MIVCMSRRICVALYDQIVKLRPNWHSHDDKSGDIKIVMTGAASDPNEWQQHIGGKARRELLAKRAKDPDDALKLVIVRDMWLTGFDAPSMHTMYIDKPMRGHGLMQAIARVNRVFRDKPAGLIVDFIGVAQNLKSALGQYSRNDRRHAGIDTTVAIEVMVEKYEVVRDMFHGFEYRAGLTGSPQERLVALAGAIEWILETQQRDAAKESTKEGKKRAHRRFNDAVLELSKAFALASGSDEARDIRDEVGFFQTVRAALAKSTLGSGKSSAERDLAVQQIVSRAVVSTEIIDILKAAGVETPDISILSDEFLAEIEGMEHTRLGNRPPNLASQIDDRNQTSSKLPQAHSLTSSSPRSKEWTEKPRDGSATQAHQRRDTLAEPRQRCPDPGLLRSVRGGDRPLPHQCHYDGGGASGADQAREGHPRRAPPRGRRRTERGGDLVL